MSKLNDIRTRPRAPIRQRFMAANDGKDGFNFATLELGPPLEGKFVKTSSFNAPRNYANGLHEGADYDIIGEPVDSKKHVLCMYDGIVTRAEDRGTGYGIHVIVKCRHEGKAFFIWQCHLDAAFVKVGDKVTRGQSIGELGGTGGDFAEHVHVNLQVPNFGADGYAIPNAVDPAPFIP